MSPVPGRWWRRLLVFMVLLLAAAGLSGRWVWQDYRAFIDAPLPNGEEERVLEVKRGDSFVHVLRRLRSIGVRSGHDLYWRGLAWELGVMRRLQVGEYAVEHAITPRELLLRIERARDHVIEEGLDTASMHPFKGNIDLARLDHLCRSDKARIPHGMLTITNRVTNTADPQRAIRSWARALRDALDSLYKPAA